MLLLAVLLQEEAGRGGALIPWPNVVVEYAGFLAYFAMLGALGFRYVVLRSGAGSLASEGSGALADAAARNAARIAVIGAVLFLLDLAASAMRAAARAHSTLGHVIQRSGGRIVIPAVLGVLLLVVFLLAMRRVRWAWGAAVLLAIVLVLRDITSGRWLALVNPLHEAAASLWLGTLFVVVAAGIPVVLHHSVPRERRGALVAGLITRFSPLALVSAGFLVLTGVITAWVHLKYLSALWTTPYGLTLILKLCVVAIVVALGAFNWRRMTPKLGAEETAHAIRRSSTTELVFGAVVLAFTAVFVSLPSPKRPGQRQGAEGRRRVTSPQAVEDPAPRRAADTVGPGVAEHLQR